MSNVCQILVSPFARRLALAASVVAMLAACGQRGPLFLPTDPAAADRATLTETIRPAAANIPAAPASAPPAAGTANPVRTP
jgi:predicted small lipoprotein YifL